MTKNIDKTRPLCAQIGSKKLWLTEKLAQRQLKEKLCKVCPLYRQCQFAVPKQLAKRKRIGKGKGKR